MTHRCHAYLCSTPVPKELLMCRDHWRMVSWATQRLVWRTYRPGQCDDKRPSAAWMVAAYAAEAEVALKEGHHEAAQRLVQEAKRWRERMAEETES